LHALNVIYAAENELRLREQLCDVRIILLQQDLAGGSTMKMTLAERQHIERHHTRQHVVVRQRLAQHGDVAGAILKTDNHGVLRGMLRDQVRNLGGIVALDGDKDDVCVRKKVRRIVGQLDLSRR
jgi:hypothetical protein